uniref:Uncharacterized protein n=1 Tax=Arundo donax TaxID=35708 RepID=A0A0A9CZ33_ARUDO
MQPAIYYHSILPVAILSCSPSNLLLLITKLERKML